MTATKPHAAYLEAIDANGSAERRCDFEFGGLLDMLDYRTLRVSATITRGTAARHSMDGRPIRVEPAVFAIFAALADPADPTLHLPLRPDTPLDEPEAPSPAAPAAGNALLWLLLAVAGVFAIARPRPASDYFRLVDWQTIGALAGLLAITQALERSGVLQAAAQRLLLRVTRLRQLAFLLAGGAAVLAAFVTNDVSLFLLVPLTRVLAGQAELPLARLVVIEALAVNAGSALTPIGNPQNLFLWHRSGQGFGSFVAMMAPTVAVMLAWLAIAVWLLVDDKPIALKPAQAGALPVSPGLLWLAGTLFIGFVVALDRHWLLAGLGVVFGALLVTHPKVLAKVDWALLAIVALMFIDLRQLAELPGVAQWLHQWPIQDGWRAYAAAIAASQFISNVPATILLDNYVTDLPALAAGVSIGGFGCVLGSLANLIALRLAQVDHGLREFHRISIPFLIVCASSAALLRLG